VEAGDRITTGPKSRPEKSRIDFVVVMGRDKRSAKPLFVGSTPIRASNNLALFAII